VGEFVRIRNRNGHARMSTHQHPLENLTAQCGPGPLVRKLPEGRRQCAPANSIRIDRMTTGATSLSKSLTFDRILRRRAPGKEDRERRGQEPDPDKALQGRFPSIAMLQHAQDRSLILRKSRRRGGYRLRLAAAGVGIAAESCSP
jgi:hypothetical protein